MIELTMIYAASFFTTTDMDIHTFFAFMYYDDIMNFIIPICGSKIDSTAIPHRISPRNQGTARKMPRPTKSTRQHTRTEK